MLGFVNQSGITGSYNAATGVLTLTGHSRRWRSTRTRCARSPIPTPARIRPNAPRTVDFQVDDGGGLVALGNVGVNVIPVLDPPNDINGDRTSDIVWRNDAGTVALWEMDGVDVLSNHGDRRRCRTTGTSSTPTATSTATAAATSCGATMPAVVVLWTMDGPDIVANTAVAGADRRLLAHRGHRRLHRRRPRRHPVARRLPARVVLWEMDGADHRQQHARGGRADHVADRGHRRLHRRRHERHPVARRRRHDPPVGDGRRHRGADTTIAHAAGPLAVRRHRRLQRRLPLRHPVARRRRHGGAVGDGRRQRSSATRRSARCRTTGTSPTSATTPATSTSDILWRDDAGTIALWEMDGPTIVDNSAVNTIPTNWHIVS